MKTSETTTLVFLSLEENAHIHLGQDGPEKFYLSSPQAVTSEATYS